MGILSRINIENCLTQGTNIFLPMSLSCEGLLGKYVKSSIFCSDFSHFPSGHNALCISQLLQGQLFYWGRVCELHAPTILKLLLLKCPSCWPQHVLCDIYCGIETAGTDGEWRLRAGMFRILQLPVCVPLGWWGAHPTQISTTQFGLCREVGLLAPSEHRKLYRKHISSSVQVFLQQGCCQPPWLSALCFSKYEIIQLRTKGAVEKGKEPTKQ